MNQGSGGRDRGGRVQGSGIRGLGSGVRESMNFESYRDLKVWQEAMDLVVECYGITREFPKSETFGLSGQLQRAAVSIAANVAEGRSRQHTKEFLQHLSIAYGSLAELETHLQIAERLNYIDSNRSKQLLDKASTIGRMLNGLRKSLKQKT